MKTNKIQEVDVIVKNANDVKTLASTNSLDKNSKIYVDPTAKPGAVTEEDNILEPEAVITPQDDATIKYLSNVRDKKTGEISQPFTIADKKYQMVRGIKPSKEIVMAVFCHDELNESGENVIHPIDHFEKTIVQPIMEKEAMMQQEVMFGNDIEEKVKPEPKGMESLNLSEFKHYLVNEKTGKFRKFKNVVELAAAVMVENEKYMPIKEFRKYFEERVFGGKPKRSEEVINELGTAVPTQPVPGAAPVADDDATLLSKAKRLVKSMDEVPRVDKSLDYLANSKNYKEKTQALNAFLDRINIKPGDVPKYLATVKNVGKELKQAGAPAATAPVASTELAPVGVAERKVITKAELTESLLKPKVIKTIKVKDIK
jgi:hypothetical protein